MRQSTSASQPHPYLLWSLVFCGVTALSFASILIRLADAPSLAIATYRVGLASLILAPHFSLHLPATWRRCNVRIVAATFLSGFFLALHFTFWIRSLQLTSVASSATLVNTTPLFVALFSYFWLGDHLSNRSWFGILLVLAGSGLIAGNDFRFSRGALLGDLLAVAGALAASGYLIAGSFVRRHLDLSAYTFGAYGSAALVLIAFSTLTATPLAGFSSRTYLILILLAIIPQLIGHTSFNWTLRFLAPTTVAVLILGEPIGATLLAYLFFAEGVSAAKALGLSILGMGIILSTNAPPKLSKADGTKSNFRGLRVEVDRVQENK